ncbi:GNAT family N-acetyltransferase [Mesobacillus subterraneus]|uniref:GNAT family N-acetyltransferase n=1 Tax=Mesobacillus subterraneus TaxID=285983 RepID=UPI00203C2B4B|nr:GNAT family N-acetyltransferase [Mesobacillus subterraneus]
MTDQVYLVKPNIKLEKEYLEFYEEWKVSGEKLAPSVIRKAPSDFAGMVDYFLNNEKGINLPEGWVHNSTYWLVNENNRVLGATNIRHELTERLYNSEGHIGCGIRPSERRKGFGTKILSLSLEKMHELGISKVLVTCNEGNVGSERAILKNGGKEDVSYTEENGNVVKRFWIDLERMEPNRQVWC